MKFFPPISAAAVGAMIAAPALSNTLDVRVEMSECLAEAIDVVSPRGERVDGEPIPASMRNKLGEAISGVEYVYEVSTEGRSVPWLTLAGRHQAIPGGIEPNELRTDIHLLPGETIEEEWFDPLVATIRITDLLDAGGESLTRRGIVCSTSSRKKGDDLSRSARGCWVVDVGSRAAEVVVVVGFDIERGRPAIDSMRLVEQRSQYGRNDPAVDAAYAAARRAILRCAAEEGRWDVPDQPVLMEFDPTVMLAR